MKGKLIVIEGVDSAGKKTQTNLLVEKLRASGVACRREEFPTYERTQVGKLISSYLKGELGSKESLPPETVSLIYSLDRYQFKSEWESVLESGEFIVADRFTPSNMAYHGAKLSWEDGLEFAEWVELSEERLPKPDVIFFMKVSTSTAAKFMQGRGGARDIHESDSDYMERVRLIYEEFAKRRKWVEVECGDGEGGMKSIEGISASICSELEKRGLAKFKSG
jgi:dTMP kinase